MYDAVRLIESRTGEPRTQWMTSAELNTYLGIKRGTVAAKINRGGGYFYHAETKEFRQLQLKKSGGEIETLPTSKPH